MSNEIVAFNDLSLMANAVAKSGFLGTKSPEDALTIMMVAQSEGRHPGSVIKDYHIINGKPSLKADAMVARFQQAGGKLKWIKLDNTIAEAEFTHEQGGSITISWTIEQANTAGLTKNPTWKKFPRAMLRSRVVSEGIRTIYPAVISGTYTPEEVEDFTPQPQQPREADYVEEGITLEQKTMVSDAAIELNWSKEEFSEKLGIKSTAEITVDNWEEIKNKLNIKEN